MIGLLWLIREIQTAPIYGIDRNTLIIKGDGDVDSSWRQEFSPLTVFSIEINDGIKRLLSKCFEGCINMRRVSLPPSLELIDNSFGNTGLESIHIPRGVTKITNIGVYLTTSLVDISVDPLNTEYSSHEHCLYSKDFSVLISGAVGRTSISFHENLSTINDWSCASNSFERIDFPDSVTHIGSYGFVGSKAKFITFSATSRLETVSEAAFQSSQIKLLIIPPKLKKTSIRMLYISTIENFTYHPNSSLAFVSIFSFDSCKNLKYVNLPKTITSIDPTALTGCNKIESITIEDGCENYRARNGYLFSSNLSELIFVPPLTQILVLPRNTSSISHSLLQGNEALVGVSFESNESDFFDYEGGVLYDRGFLSARYAIGSIERADIRSQATNVGLYCFAGIGGLKRVVFGEDSNCTIFNEYAFKGCRSLEEVVFPPKLQFIYGFCFQSTGLKRAVIPPNVSLFDQYSFQGVTSSLNFTFEKCISQCAIEFKAFYGTTFSTLILPEGITSIGSMAFYGCSAPSLSIPSSVSSIEESAFSEFRTASALEFGDGSRIEGLNASLFSGFGSLETAFLPGSIATISGSVFAGCKNLKEIVWMTDAGLQRIDDMAFSQCESFETFTVPSTVTSIVPTAFYQCFNLMSFEVSGATYSTLDGMIVKGGSSICVFPPGRKEGFVAESIKGIEERAFYGCSKLVKLDFAEDSVRSIGKNTFFGCSNLSSLLLPGTVQSIMDKAFESCSSLQTIKISDNSQLRQIGASTFSGCSQLAHFEFLGSSILEEIGDSTFGGSKLTSFKFPSSIAKIGSSAFSKCADLISLEFEDGCPLLNTLEASCFSETKIESIEVPKGVRKIKDNCFGFCSKLKNVTLPDGLAEIGVRSFISCDLREIVLPLSAVKIGEGAFSANPNLRRVYYCGEEAFQDRTVFVNSAKSIEVYTMSNYSETTLCGIECKRVMRRCMFLPSAEFSVFNENKALSIEISIIVIQEGDDN